MRSRVANESFSDHFDELHNVTQAMSEHIANDVEVYCSLTMHEHVAESDGRPERVG